MAARDPHKHLQWQALDLLCRLGLGLAPIASEVCALLRLLVGADAAALLWLDERGAPAGFHHEDSPAHVRNLFLNEFDRLFVGPGETNIVALAQPGGPRVGRLLSPGAAHFRSNSHNLLMRPNGHHHILDLRVEAHGRPRAVVGLFRAPGPGFSDAHAALLERAGTSLARAFTPTDAKDGTAQATGHVLLDTDGHSPLLADATALRLLQNAHLPGLGLYGATTADLPADLPRHLRLRPDEERSIPVPDGVLHAHMHAMRPLAGSTAAAPHWLISLQWQRPQQIDVVRRVLALPLNPLQREIAAAAGLGLARADCMAATGIGNALMKKHLRTILDVTGASDWEALAHGLQGESKPNEPPSPMH